MFNPHRFVRLSAGALCLLLASVGAQAADGATSVGLTAGTLGAGPEIGHRYGEKFGVRLNGGFFSFDRSEEVDGIGYDGDLELNSVGLLADWYPVGGGFRISLGLRANNNELDLTASPTESVEIGGVTYTPAQVGRLVGKAKLGEDVAPMLSIGYAGRLAQGFTLGFELGVVFQGSPTIEEFRSEGGQFSNNSVFLQSVERERQEVEDEIDDYEIWPAVQVMLLYRF